MKFKNGIRLTIIPITFKETLFKDYQVGRKINIESDLLARYIYAQLQGKNKGLSWEEVERIFLSLLENDKVGIFVLLIRIIMFLELKFIMRIYFLI